MIFFPASLSPWSSYNARLDFYYTVASHIKASSQRNSAICPGYHGAGLMRLKIDAFTAILFAKSSDESK